MDRRSGRTRHPVGAAVLASCAIAALLALAPAVHAATGLVISPSSAVLGATVTASATGFPAGPVTFRWDNGELLGTAEATVDGTAELTFNIPGGTTLGVHFVRACATIACPPGAVFADARVTVVEPGAATPTPAATPTAAPASAPPTPSPRTAASVSPLPPGSGSPDAGAGGWVVPLVAILTLIGAAFLVLRFRGIPRRAVAIPDVATSGSPKPAALPQPPASTVAPAARADAAEADVAPASAPPEPTTEPARDPWANVRTIHVHVEQIEPPKEE